MEYSLDEGWSDASDYLFCYNGSSNPTTIKNNASAFMCALIKDPAFAAAVLDDKKDDGGERKLGTHSMRKFAATFAKMCGCSKDEIDYRFRWKCRRMQDRYIEGSIPWPDAKVAAALCKHGPITYQVKEESKVSETWLLTHVVPNIYKQYSKTTSLILGRALLWRIMDPDQSAVLPKPMVTRVRHLYQAIDGNQLTPEENPIARVPISLHQIDGKLIVTTLEDEMDDDGTNPDGTPMTEEQHFNRRKRKYGGDAIERRMRNRRSDNEQLSTLTSQVLHLRNENKQLKLELEASSARTQDAIKVVNRNVRQLMRSSAVGGGVRRGAAVPLTITTRSQNNAILMDRPKSLHMLWNEYMFGIGGSKPAKEYTPQESHGVKNKDKFNMRKQFWLKCAEMVNAGWNAEEAINQFYQVYNHGHYRCQNLTQILKAIKKDARAKPPTFANSLCVLPSR